MIQNGLEQRCDELTPYEDGRFRKEWISSPLKALLKCPFLYHTAPAAFAIRQGNMPEGQSQLQVSFSVRCACCFLNCRFNYILSWTGYNLIITKSCQRTYLKKFSHYPFKIDSF